MKLSAAIIAAGLIGIILGVYNVVHIGPIPMVRLGLSLSIVAVIIGVIRLFLTAK